MRRRLLLEGVRMALRAIRQNKLRSLLTLVANVVAVTSVMAVVSVLAGMDAYMKSAIAGEGTDVFRIERVDGLQILSSFDEFIESLRNPKITLDDADALESGLSEAAAVAGQLARTAPLSSGRLSVDEASVQGVTARYPDVGSWPLAAGRHLAASEVRRAAPVAVIGWDVAEKLFPGLDPLERDVEVRGRHFRVVGVIERKGALFGQSQDLYAVLPIGAWQKLFGYRDSLTIGVRVRDLARMQQAVDEAVVAMRVRHRLRPGQRDDFAVVTTEAMLSLWQRFSRLVFLALPAIAGISLVVGGIIIMNVMLVSVTERTREIGVRKALGARRRTILWQFLVESVTFSLTGGAVGVALGFVAAAAVAAWTPLPYAVEAWAVVAGLVVTAGAGLVFGLFPAWRAAGLDPIEALRHE